MTSLEERRAAPVQECIEALRELLAKAESGELRTFVFCGIALGEEVIRARSTTEGNVFHLLGAWELSRESLVRFALRDYP